MSGQSFFTTQRLLYWVALFFGVVLALIYGFYQWQLENARHQEYAFHQAQMSEKIAILMEEKAEITQAIAVSVSANPIFKKALLDPSVSIQQTLIDYSDALKSNSSYKHVWIQLIDSKGASLARSWTDKRHDNLLLVRADIASLIERPRHINTISVGKFALTFKSMVPLFNDQQQLIGILEVITQVNSVDRNIQKNTSSRSVVLVDRQYQQQLVHVPADQFLDGYFVANQAATPEDKALIERLGVQNTYNSRHYKIFDNHLLVLHPLQDLDGNKLANWINITPLDAFHFVNLQQIQRQFLITVIFIFVLLILLVAMVHFKRRADFERRFFFEVFDTATEIIYVLKSGRIMLANKQFFDFFHPFKTVEAFHQKHDCICEFFVSEAGFLKLYMGQEYWLDYLVRHPDIAHYVKIKKADKVSIFLIKAAEVRNERDDQYVSVLMSDVTEESHYKTQLEQLIIHDELTGIYNRHYFNQVLEGEIKRHHRYQTPLSMAFMDIDYFKKINDQFGHDAGDVVLRDLTKTISGTLRDTDIFCRIGGEEFVVIMPQTNLKDALSIAERIRVFVAKSTSHDAPKKVTLSIGVAELSADTTADQLYKLADRALYQAKEKGRNRVEPKA